MPEEFHQSSPFVEKNLVFPYTCEREGYPYQKAPCKRDLLKQGTRKLGSSNFLKHNFIAYQNVQTLEKCLWKMYFYTSNAYQLAASGSPSSSTNKLPTSSSLSSLSPSKSNKLEFSVTG